MSFLEKILEVKSHEVKKLKQKFNLSDFSDFEFFTSPSLDFANKINLENQIALIAEIKKASPSKGIINSHFDHLKIAKIYMKNNVAAISVLTDEKFFHGNIDYLHDIAKIKTVPLLRKDFLIDTHQIFEAKAFGADTILLISEALSKNQTTELTHAATELGLSVLLELHSSDQINKIDFTRNNIIGINNRNLNTFEVDINFTLNLKNLMPSDILIVSESGLSKKEKITKIKTRNVNAVLVGEHFMRAENIDDSINEFKSWCLDES